MTLQRVFAGGIHSSAYASETPLRNQQPPAVCVVEQWDSENEKWISVRQIWNETAQRYEVAA